MFETEQPWNRRAFLRAMGVFGLTGTSILLIGCKHQDEASKSNQTAPPKRPQTHAVQMASADKHHFFDPDRLRIQPGDTVRWVLQSNIHTTTAYHPEFFGKPARIPDQAKPWHSGVLKDVGQSFELQFDDEGVYNYYCTPHQSLGMVGILVVGRPLDGPGLMPLPDSKEMEGMMMEGMLYPREIEKLTELVAWAKKLNS